MIAGTSWFPLSFHSVVWGLLAETVAVTAIVIVIVTVTVTIK